MDIGVDIVDFKRPSANSKNLFISNIPSTYASEEDLEESLTKKFSYFGLIFEVQVFNVTQTDTREIPGPSEQSSFDSGYAFVKFYSTKSAIMAKQALGHCLVLKGQKVKVNFAARKKEFDEKRVLPCVKCKELANHYLGFNGWNSKIVMLEETNADLVETNRVEYVCILQIDIINHGVCSKGLGAWSEEFTPTDPTSKSKAICKSKKFAQHRAMENSFRKLVVAILPSGKLWVDIDHRQEDEHMPTLKKQSDYTLLKVNDLNEEPLDSSSDEDRSGFDNSEDDMMNQILMDLEES